MLLHRFDLSFLHKLRLVVRHGRGTMSGVFLHSLSICHACKELVDVGRSEALHVRPRIPAARHIS
jgi:hypothetical protein